MCMTTTGVVLLTITCTAGDVDVFPEPSVARVTTTDAESAAVLQGTAHRLVTAAVALPESAEAIRPPDSTDFVTQLRRDTSGLLREALGEARLRELRAQGAAMDDDHAVAYALEVIARAL